MDIIFIIIGIAILLAVYLVGKRQVSHKKNEMDEILGKQSGFQVSQKLISIYGDFCLAIDEINRKVCFVAKNKDTVIQICNYNDLISSSLIENETEIMKTERRDGVGVVADDLSEKTKAVKKVNSIKLQIIVDDTKNPIHLVEFLYQKSNKKSVRYRQTIGSAVQWHSLISDLLKRDGG